MWNPVDSIKSDAVTVTKRQAQKIFSPSELGCALTKHTSGFVLSFLFPSCFAQTLKNFTVKQNGPLYLHYFVMASQALMTTFFKWQQLHGCCIVNTIYRTSVIVLLLSQQAGCFIIKQCGGINVLLRPQ